MSYVRTVTLVNRSSKSLHGVCAGVHYQIPPGTHVFPEPVAQMFKAQNPVMGSEDPYTLEKQYLIGIVEQEDDITPCEQSTAIERFNRSLIGGPITEIIKAKGGLYVRSADNALPAATAASTAPIGGAFGPADK